LDLNYIEILSNLTAPNRTLEKIEIKYGCEGFEEGNNFLHRNFFRFKMGIELKCGEFNVCF
jgi:hypothetical protein